MSILGRLTIGQKLTSIGTLSSVIALVSASIAFLVLDTRSFRESTTRRIQTDAQIVGFNSISPILFGDADAARATLQGFKADPAVISAVILWHREGASDESRLAAYGRGGAMPSSGTPAGLEKGGRVFSGGRLIVVEPIRFEDKVIGRLIIEAELGELRDRQRRLAAVVIAVLGISFLLAVSASRLVARTISRPILDLAETARAVSAGKDYSVRAHGGGRDEVGQLIETFNQMLDQIQRQDAALQEARDELELRVEARTRELAAANKELEAFSYSVSHDLRAPLRAIDGFSKFLMSGYADKLDDRGRHYLERVRAGTLRMAELIDALLGLSRISRQELIRRPIDLSELAGRVAAELRTRTPGREIPIEIEPGMRCEGDPRLLVALLENLMGNAWKFTAKCSCPRIQVARRGDGETAFFVRDNGAGFDMNYADKLFGAFQRLHSDAEFEGTGIGLATVHRIVTRHGGRIWAEGQVGEGATFYFTLEPRP
jgi:signal transduction histidine kinase